MSATPATEVDPARETNFFRWAAILALVVFILAGAFLSYRHQGGVVFPDEQEYYTLAGNLVKDHMLTWDGTTPTASRPPGFVFWLAIWKALGVGWTGLVWLNTLVVAAALWVLSGAWFPRVALWRNRVVVFGLLFAYPVSLYVFSTLYPQAFCLALIAFALALLLGNGGLWRAVFSGALMGWCVLSAPMYLSWVGILALVPLFRRRLAGLPTAVVFGVVCVLVIGCWGLRNAAVMGKFVPFSTNSGFNLLIGNNENTRPNAGLNIDVSRWTNEAAAKHLNEVEADAFYGAAAKEWITSHPGQAISLYFRKVLNNFNFRNELVTTSAASPARDALMFVTYYGLLVLLIARLVSTRAVGPLEWREGLVLLGYLACAMFTSLATTRIRYRVPCDVLLFFVVAPWISMHVAGVVRRFWPRAKPNLAQR